MCINEEINVNCSAVGRHVRVAIENTGDFSHVPNNFQKYMVAAVSLI